ncbi:MAG: histidine phosphatase family protein, partial [bacterium]
MPGLINDDEPSTGISEEVRPEEEFQPGDLAPIWSGPIAPASISEGLENALIAQCTLCGNKDVAARRWEVEQDWEARLYNRGNQNILPRRGGGWVVPPYATLYNQSRSNKSGQKFFGHETNIVAAYGSIITAALGRDIPAVRFEPQNPMCDADVTAANAATRYARLFNHSNDLLTFQNQCIYYLYTGGRVIVCVDSILDGQRFGREEIFAPEPVVPETEENPPHPAFFLVRHGETAMNRQNRARGRSETPLDNLGTSQVEQAANYLKGKPIAAIISSPIERARESAQILAKSLNLPVAMDERLASFDLGSETGQQISSMREIFDNAKKNPNEPVGDTGESFSQFNGRLESFLSELLANPGGPAPLLVTHDSVIRQIASILNGPQGWLPGFTPPGGVAICDPLEDGTYRLHPTYPATPPPAPSHRTRPRSREITSCYGKLEAHVPINCQSLEEMPFVQLCREYDVSIVKAMFPA